MALFSRFLDLNPDFWIHTLGYVLNSPLFLERVCPPLHLEGAKSLTRNQIHPPPHLSLPLLMTKLEHVCLLYSPNFSLLNCFDLFFSRNN